MAVAMSISGLMLRDAAAVIENRSAWAHYWATSVKRVWNVGTLRQETSHPCELAPTAARGGAAPGARRGSAAENAFVGI